MEIRNKKINPYVIIIVILSLIIVGLAYNQWGKDILANLKFRLSGSSKSELGMGSDNAKVKIIEYYSYLCTYCKEFEDTVKPQIIKNYVSTGKVKIILRPLDLGEAVLCANEQGKFLEYHDYLFKNAANFKNEEDLKTFAQSTGMDGEQFWQCYSSGKYFLQSDNWYKQAVADFDRYKVPEEQRGTPSFVVDGIMLPGIQTYETLSDLIEKELNK